MRHLIFLTFFVAFSCGLCSAQELGEFAPDFGRVDQSDFDLKSFEKDSASEAVVLYDRGKTFFGDDEEHGFLIVFQRVVRIKILKNSGLKWATFEIPFYVNGNESEEVPDIRGVTYSLNGKQVEKTMLDEKNIFEEDKSPNWRVKKFTMPNVQEGSVIEIAYSTRSPYFFNFNSWEFQRKIPVRYSEYVTQMIPFYSYKFVLQGASKFDDYSSKEGDYTRHFAGTEFRDMVYRFVMKDVPAFNDEAFITCPQDYMIRQNFQLSETTDLRGVRVSYLSTWPAFIKKLLSLGEVGGYLNGAESQAKKQVLSMNLASMKPLEQIQAIDSYMKTNFSWDENESMYAGKSFKKFLETKTGNVAELNLYYVALLKSAGLDAFPVILSTRDHGKIVIDYPFAHYFNYVVAAVLVDGKYQLFDASEPFAAFGMLPERCLNDKGLALVKSKNETQWIQLSNPVKSTISYSMELTPDLKTDSVNGFFRVASNGFYATRFKNIYAKNPSGFSSAILPSSLELKDTINISRMANDRSVSDFKFLAKAGMSVYDDKIAIEPFCSFPIVTNPLPKPTRTYPVDMTYKQEMIYQTNLHIPEGYKIFRMPGNVNIDNENVKIQFRCVQADEFLLTLVGSYEFKKDVYPSQVYEDIQKYFRTIVDVFNEEVILQKIQPEKTKTASK